MTEIPLMLLFCSHVLGHFYSTELILKEMEWVLKAAGKIYIGTFSNRSLWISLFRYGREQGIPLNFLDYRFRGNDDLNKTIFL